MESVQILLDDLLRELTKISSSIGLDPLGEVGVLLVGVVLLLVIVKIFSMPFKIVWNGLCGAVILWVVNLLGSLCGFTLKITVVKALIAGFFGIPGALAVILYELFV